MHCCKYTHLHGCAQACVCVQMHSKHWVLGRRLTRFWERRAQHKHKFNRRMQCLEVRIVETK